jgi:hypothetical protein
MSSRCLKPVRIACFAVSLSESYVCRECKAGINANIVHNTEIVPELGLHIFLNKSYGSAVSAVTSDGCGAFEPRVRCSGRRRLFTSASGRSLSSFQFTARVTPSNQTSVIDITAFLRVLWRSSRNRRYLCAIIRDSARARDFYTCQHSFSGFSRSYVEICDGRRQDELLCITTSAPTNRSHRPGPRSSPAKGSALVDSSELNGRFCRSPSD